MSGAGYYYGSYTAEQFNLSSRMAAASPEALKAAGVRATLKPSPMIEDFEGDWQKEWFTYKPDEWPRKTHKVYSPIWAAPAGAKLALEVRCDRPYKLVVGLDDYAAEIHLSGGAEWQRVDLSPANFQNAAGEPLPDWGGLKELRLADQETLQIRAKNLKRKVGDPWKGDKPSFRKLQWVR